MPAPVRTRAPAAPLTSSVRQLRRRAATAPWLDAGGWFCSTLCSRLAIAAPVSVSSTSAPACARTMPSSPQPAPTSMQRTAGP
eukprot:4742237-Prymnesium_polylepis.2